MNTKIIPVRPGLMKRGAIWLNERLVDGLGKELRMSLNEPALSQYRMRESPFLPTVYWGLHDIQGDQVNRWRGLAVRMGTR